MEGIRTPQLGIPYGGSRTPVRISRKLPHRPPCFEPWKGFAPAAVHFFGLMRGHPPSQSLRQPSAPPGAIRGGVTPAAPILSRRRHRHGPSAVRPAFGGGKLFCYSPGRRPPLEPEAAPLRWGAPPGEERQACPRHVQALPLHIAGGRPPSCGFTVQFASALRFPGANGRFQFRHRSPAPPRDLAKYLCSALPVHRKGELN